MAREKEGYRDNLELITTVWRIPITGLARWTLA